MTKRGRRSGQREPSPTAAVGKGMATVVLLVDGAPPPSGGPPLLRDLVHALARGASHTGCVVKVLGLADTPEAAAALAGADIRELPQDQEALEELLGADAIIVGGPSARGAMAPSVGRALETLAALPSEGGGAAGALSGKVGSVFTCAVGAGVGGHETALSATHTALLSCGMVVCGVRPSPQLAKLEAGTPLGVCQSPGQEQRVEACRAAEQQGQQVADIAARLQLASVVAQLRA